ncbi:eukaryotic peptide chain release factor GTP-binding subunit [Grosmannia clavigera kw1407]|uniref:Elongation factor 1-alpha n=1 Tax=Grosmannia clavigera (strain kw1407 / UAMH 11150) TaxID=655863 RepID=F0XNY5_GROCL|nr:eukaryotic peptide chain release factor GTP-binding subunit [Grosmannia clavigera kw1407]EFX00090.1 eukaryotic peptide chain release factor GTP-binding subunit [Grosmannia clavigera kw1407]
MSHLNSWEDDPAAQDENLARQAQQQLNVGGGGGRGNFHVGAATFQPGAATFNPGQAYGGAPSFVPQYQQPQQQQQYYNQGYGFQQYGQQQTGFDQHNQGYGGSGYNSQQASYQQGGYNQSYGQYSGGYQQQSSRGGAVGQYATRDTPTIAKRTDSAAGTAASATASTISPKPAGNIGAKVLSIGGDAAKPKVAKVLSIGTPAPAKEESKKEEAAPKVDSTSAEAGAKITAAKAIEKTTGDKAGGSGKTSPSPSPSSGRSSPARAGTEKITRDVDAVQKEQAADVDDDTLKEIYGKEHVNIIFIGHVDAGKSTLGGSILYVTGMVDQRTMDKYKREAKEMGRETWYLSWALDLTNEERTKGKTVEVGRGHFETDKRRYSILDAPGHKTYVPSMIGGASQADVGILVISARKGEYETGFEKGGQTREHAMLAKTQGVNKLIVVINKMDDPTVNWSQDRYKECTTKLSQFLKGTGYNLKTDVFFMPIAAQQTTNIKDRIPKGVADWYNGPSLLEYLDNMQTLERKLNAPFMMAINSKYRDLGTMVEGKIEAGVVKKGMGLIMMPNKQNIDVTAVYGETEDEMSIAQCGDQVRLRLRGVEEEDVQPGFVLCSPKRLVHNVKAFEAQVRILELKSILTAGYNCVLHVHSAIEEVTFSALLHKLQKGTGRKSKVPPSHAKKGESIIARLEVIGGAGSVCVERFEDYPQMGRFTLRDQGQTIAIGKIIKLITDSS